MLFQPGRFRTDEAAISLSPADPDLSLVFGGRHLWDPRIPATLEISAPDGDSLLYRCRLGIRNFVTEEVCDINFEAMRNDLAGAGFLAPNGSIRPIHGVLDGLRVVVILRRHVPAGYDLIDLLEQVDFGHWRERKDIGATLRSFGLHRQRILGGEYEGAYQEAVKHPSKAESVRHPFRGRLTALATLVQILSRHPPQAAEKIPVLLERGILHRLSVEVYVVDLFLNHPVWFGRLLEGDSRIAAGELREELSTYNELAKKYLAHLMTEAFHREIPSTAATLDLLFEMAHANPFAIGELRALAYDGNPQARECLMRIDPTLLLELAATDGKALAAVGELAIAGNRAAAIGLGRLAETSPDAYLQVTLAAASRKRERAAESWARDGTTDRSRAPSKAGLEDTDNDALNAAMEALLAA